MDVAELNPVRLRSVTVAEAMGPITTVSSSTPMVEAAAIIKSRRGRALVVETGDDSPSIFTEFDIVKVIADGGTVEDLTVGDHHTRIAIAATPDWTLDRAMETMMRGQFRHLVVVEDGVTVGMLAMRDIIDAILDPSDQSDFDPDETVEIAAIVPEEAERLLHDLRRSAKQHLVAAKCDCELDWIEVVIGQAEERADLTADELQEIWEQRQPCPTLHAMGGGGD
ncbi:MAG: cyclic nucleotide-binding/CBS domain-containing protein [Solirubrobacterales bacterium]